MPRKRKPGARNKSGRLSRAYAGPARDTGTPEFCAKRTYLINGSDPQLAASASGILLANGFLDRDQLHVAMVYAWTHALIYGRPWRQACPLGERTGGERPDELLERSEFQALDIEELWDEPEHGDVGDRVALLGRQPRIHLCQPHLGTRICPPWEYDHGTQALPTLSTLPRSDGASLLGRPSSGLVGPSGRPQFSAVFPRMLIYPGVSSM